MKLYPVSSEFDGKEWTLIFEREFKQPIELMWRALTDPKWVGSWTSYEPDRDLGSLGPVTLTMTDGPEPQPIASEVTIADRPVTLQYTWGPHGLRWDLCTIPEGTRLTLRHTVPSADWMPKVAAGWHICLDTAERRLNGEDAKRVVGMDALDCGWDELHTDYAEKLGVATTPLPEEMTNHRK